jgi:hypothetical protein
MAEGQELGVRDKYTYTMDDGSRVRLVLDKTLGDVEENGLVTSTTTDGAGNKPLNFKPRVVFVQRTTPGGRTIRKQIVCNADSPLYTAETVSNVDVGVEEYQTTGRRGETLSF